MSHKIFQKGLKRMMKVVGAPCAVIVQGVKIPFNGIPEVVDSVESDDLGMSYIRKETTLLVTADIGRRLEGLVNTPMTMDGQEVFCNEVRFEDDGEVARLFITRPSRKDC